MIPVIPVRYKLTVETSSSFSYGPRQAKLYEHAQNAQIRIHSKVSSWHLLCIDILKGKRNAG